MSSSTTLGSAAAPRNPAPAAATPAPAAARAAKPAAPAATSAISVLQRPQSKASWGEAGSVVFISLILHGIVLFACSLVVFEQIDVQEIYTTIFEAEEPKNEPIVEKSPLVPEELQDEKTDAKPEMNNLTQIADIPAPVDTNMDQLEPTTNYDAADSDVGINIKVSDHVGGRSAAAKSALVKAYGGNTASEAAVLSGLRWLAKHQRKDGSFSFDHITPESDETNGNAGTLRENLNGATGLALLAFLGAGHTHKEGDYSKEVKRALDFMLKPESYKVSANGADFGGKVVANEHMYVHGLVTIALCEALALSKDTKLRKPALEAAKFIVSNQRKDGGWRYGPGDFDGPSDTSVVGWQVMALKSAQLSRLQVPPTAFKGIEKFLDAMASDNGGRYAYDISVVKSPSPSMTAVGLLCRMYMGWTPNKNVGLKKGVAWLSEVGPSPGDMYYNYYATQVLHHWGGEEWTKWNNRMRDHLVNTQVKKGYGAGSWTPAGGHGGEVGGRLYETCLSIMTLEVYYRHLPLYQREKIKTDI